jgi:hypothetical protein
MQKIVTSKQFSLKLRDFLKGALMAVLVPCLLIVQQSLDKGEFTFNWKAIGMTAVGAFISYLLKNFLDRPKVVITTATNEKADEQVKDLLKNKD